MPADTEPIGQIDEFMALNYFDLDFNYADLLNLCQLNEKNALLATIEFKRKYANHKFVIYYDFPMPIEVKPVTKIMLNAAANMKAKSEKVFDLFKWFDSKKEEKVPEPMTAPKPPARPKYIERGQEIRMCDHEMILKTFNCFGHLITRLWLISIKNSTDSQAQFVGELISNKSSTSLLEVHIQTGIFNAAKILNFITKPLANAKTVIFQGYFFNPGDKGLEMHEQFPAVDRLYLECVFSGFDCIGARSPHLKHLHVKFHANSGYDFMLSKNCRSNAFIRTIELDFNIRMPSNYIESLSALVPNLETLILRDFQPIKHQTCFANVTTLFVTSARSSPHNLYFPKLQNLSIIYKNENCQVWKTFLQQHKHSLTIFELEHAVMEYQNVNELLDELPGSVQFTQFLPHDKSDGDY